MATLQQRRAEAHRAAQARLAEALARVVGQAYLSTVTPATIGQLTSSTFQERFVSSVLAQILNARSRSLALSRSYLAGEGVPIGDVDLAPDGAIETSLRVTGWAELLSRFERGEEFGPALEKSATGVAGAADRHALNGGRGLMAASLRSGTRYGHYRVTRPGCCAFCAMLQSRGAVYSDTSFDQSDPRFDGDGDIKVHDYCHCTWGVIERGQAEPDDVAAARDVWTRATRPSDGRLLSGAEAQNAFRRLWESTRAA